MDKLVCAIAGVGPANGASFARRFSAAGYAVALMARSEDYVAALAGELEDARGYGCDMRDADAISATFVRIREEMGLVNTLVYNAGSGLFGNIDTIGVAEFEDAWRSNTVGCLVSSQSVIPDMRSAGQGNIVVIGATASVRGGADFAAFASAKAAQRSLAQSMARLLGPEGIHVGYVIIDGVIDTEPARAMDFFSDKLDDYFLQADDIAEAVYFMTQQQRSAWTFELDLRPFGESW